MLIFLCCQNAKHSRNTTISKYQGKRSVAALSEVARSLMAAASCGTFGNDMRYDGGSTFWLKWFLDDETTNNPTVRR